MKISLGDRGPGVRRIQEFGDLLGFDTGENDGIFGPETHRTVKAIQAYLGICQDGIVGPETWEALTSGNYNIPLISGLADISAHHPLPRNFAYLRSWETIAGVTLHQTGCMMPADPMGWARVNAHYGVTQEGVPILINRPENMIWHAQGLSKRSIGIEIEGNFEGIEGNRNTLWAPGGGPSYLNKAMIAATNTIYEDILGRFIDAGQKWQSVWAHRQSAKSRRADPGSEIWQRIGKPWAYHLDCSPYDHKVKLGGGRPIPKAWDGDGRGVY